MAALHIMQVLCHDFGAKRAFLLKAAGPAKPLIYFQDFRSFSNPGIRRFLTDLDTTATPSRLTPTSSAPPPFASLRLTPPLFLSHSRTVGVCSLSTWTFSILAHLHTHTSKDMFCKYGAHTPSHESYSLSRDSCKQAITNSALIVLGSLYWCQWTLLEYICVQ